MLKPLLRYHFDGLIGSAGGYIECGSQVIYDHPLPNEIRDRTLELIRKNNIFCTIECKENTYCDDNLDALLDGLEEGNSELERWRRAVNEKLDIRPISEYDGAPVYKFIIMFREDSQLDDIREQLGDVFDIVLQPDVYGVRNGELINRAFDKGKGIIRVCEHYGVPFRDTYGFGDSMNDIAMMDTVGTSVCMDNGTQALKEICDIICPSVEEDGLAKSFKALKLI